MELGGIDMKRVLVTGGRHFKDEQDHVPRTMAALVGEFGESLIFCQGGATGLDREVKDWCSRFGFPCVNWPAKWRSSRNYSAGPVRNEQMLRWFAPHILLSFPGNSGTADMTARASSRGVEIRRIG